MSEFIGLLVSFAVVIVIVAVFYGLVTGWRPRRPRWRSGYVWISPAIAPFPRHARKHDLLLRGTRWYAYRGRRRGWEQV